MDKRITVRFNELEVLELETLKKTFGLEKDSEALKMAVAWVNHYIKNVTETFFPTDYDVIITRKRKTVKSNIKVYHK